GLCPPEIGRDEQDPGAALVGGGPAGGAKPRPRAAKPRQPAGGAKPLPRGAKPLPRAAKPRQPLFLSAPPKTALNRSTGWAPTTLVLPLTTSPVALPMKNVGVPLAPTPLPSLASSSTFALNLPLSSAALNFDMFRPSSSAYFSSEGRSRFCWFANSLS